MGGQQHIYYTIYNPRFSVFLIYPRDLKFNHFLQTNADGDTNTTSAVAAPAVGFPHSDVHFPIKKEFGEYLYKYFFKLYVHMPSRMSLGTTNKTYYFHNRDSLHRTLDILEIHENHTSKYFKLGS